MEQQMGILPGTAWKHEEPHEPESPNGPGPVLAGLLGAGQLPIGQEAIKAPPRRIFGPSSPVQPNHPQWSNMTDVQQPPPADITLVSVENGHAEYTSSISNSSHTRIGGQILRHTVRQPVRRNTRKSSQKDRLEAKEILGPVHSSKVSKAAGKAWPRSLRQQNIASEVSSGLPLISSCGCSRKVALASP